MPFNRSDTYNNRVSAASKVGLLFNRRYLRTLAWPWRVAMTVVGWGVILLVVGLAAIPVVMIGLWLFG